MRFPALREHALARRLSMLLACLLAVGGLGPMTASAAGPVIVVSLVVSGQSADPATGRTDVSFEATLTQDGAAPTGNTSGTLTLGTVEHELEFEAGTATHVESMSPGASVTATANFGNGANEVSSTPLDVTAKAAPTTPAPPAAAYVGGTWTLPDVGIGPKTVQVAPTDPQVCAYDETDEPDPAPGTTHRTVTFTGVGACTVTFTYLESTTLAAATVPIGLSVTQRASVVTLSAATGSADLADGDTLLIGTEITLDSVGSDVAGSSLVGNHHIQVTAPDGVAQTLTSPARTVTPDAAGTWQFKVTFTPDDNSYAPDTDTLSLAVTLRPTTVQLVASIAPDGATLADGALLDAGTQIKLTALGAADGQTAPAGDYEYLVTEPDSSTHSLTGAEQTTTPDAVGFWTYTVTFTPTDATRATSQTSTRVRVLPDRPFTMLAAGQPLPASAEVESTLLVAPVWNSEITPAPGTDLTDVTLTVVGADPACTLAPAATGWTVTFTVVGQTCALRATAPRAGTTYGRTVQDFSVSVIAQLVTVTLSHTPAEPKVGDTVVVKAIARARGMAVRGGTGSLLVSLNGVPIASQPPGSWSNGLALTSFTATRAGGYSFTATYTPPDEGADAGRFQDPGTLEAHPFTVGKRVVPIDFTTPVPSHAKVSRSWTAAPVNLVSGPRVVMTVGENDGVCEANGEYTVDFLKAGSCSVSFQREADDDHDGVLPVPHTITVQQIPVIVTVTTDPAARVGAPFVVSAHATDQYGQAVPGTFSPVECTPAQDSVQLACLTPVPDSSSTWTTTLDHRMPTVAQVTFRPYDTATYGDHEVDGAWSFTPARGTPRITPPADLRAEKAVGSTIIDAAATIPGGERVRAELVWTQPSGGFMDACTLSATDSAQPERLTLAFHVPGRCLISWEYPGGDDWEAASFDQWVTVTPHLSVMDAEIARTVPSATNPVNQYLVDLDTDVAEHELRVTVRDDAAASSPLQGTVSMTLVPDPGMAPPPDWVTPPQLVATTVEGEDWDYAVPLRLPQSGTYLMTLRFVPDDSLTYVDTSFAQQLVVVKRTDSHLTDHLVSEGYVGDNLVPGFTLGSGRTPTYRIESGSVDPRVCDHPGPAESPDTTRIALVSPGTCVISLVRAESRVWTWEGVTPPNPVTITSTTNETRTEVAAPESGRVGQPHELRVRTVVDNSSDGSPPNGPSIDGVYELHDGSSTSSGNSISGVVSSTDGVWTTLEWTPQRASAEVDGSLVPRPMTLRFVPDDDQGYHPSGARTEVTVSRADTQTAVEITGGAVTATVTSKEPGDEGVPQGIVSLQIDSGRVRSATLDAAGRATWTPSGIDPDLRALVHVTYAGDPDHETSQGSVTRELPTITGSASASGPVVNGWHRGPVTVTFTCLPNGSALTASGCPAPVLLRTEGFDQQVVGTVDALDGGRGRVIVGGLNIDTTAPAVSVSGPRNGALYRGAAPAARCVATDRASGVASCTLSTARVDALRHRVTVTATDRAGNRATRSVTFQVRTSWVQGAPLQGTSFVVRRGKWIRVLVRADGVQPQLVLPRRPGRAPRIPGPPMVAISIEEGVTTWTARYRVPRQFRAGKVLRLGIKARNTPLQIVRIRLR